MFRGFFFFLQLKRTKEKEGRGGRIRFENALMLESWLCMGYGLEMCMIVFFLFVFFLFFVVRLISDKLHFQ